jgi:hypothetical protein
MNSPCSVYYGLPRIIEIMSLGVNLGTTFYLEIKSQKGGVPCLLYKTPRREGNGRRLGIRNFAVQDFRLR